MNRRIPLKADREKQRAFLERGRQSSAEALGRSRRAQPPKPRDRPISPTSPAQRRRARQIGFCVACGLPADPPWRVVTAAHLWPRGMGGCDHPLCVLPLCVTANGGCHDAYDDGKLDLLTIVTGRWELCRPAVQHALEHAMPVELMQQLANARIEWRQADGIPSTDR